MTCYEKRNLAVERYTIQVPSTAEWGDSITGIFSNNHLPHIYYFVIIDCDHNTHMTFRMMPKIEVDFNIVN